MLGARGRQAALFVVITLVLSVLAPNAGASGVGGCPADFDEDGAIDFGDLLQLLSSWGDCPDPPAECPTDLDYDGMIDFGDLLGLLSNWGVCTQRGPREVELAGRPLVAYPFFEHLQSFNEGDAVHAAIDPALLDPSEHAGDLYVIAARTLDEWKLDDALVDVRGAPQPVVLDGLTIQDNTIELIDVDLVSAENGTTVGVGFQVVLDVNGNGTLDAVDLIDGFGDDAGFYLVSDMTASGPLPFAIVDHDGGAFLGQRVYYPTGVTGPLPLIIISHGNGMSHTWYDYLQRHLASWGYVVMAHQNDTMPGIEAASTTTLTNTDHLLGNLETIGGGVLDGLVDPTRIVWIGHSRGGEGVVRAYDRIRDGDDVPTEFTLDDIRLIATIGPTDFLGPDFSSPGAVPFHLLYGSADGDVSGAANCDVCRSFHLFERATVARSVTYVHGADHNDFNCCGFNDYEGPFEEEIGRDESQQVAKSALLALMQYTLDDNPAAYEYLWRPHESLQANGVQMATIVDREFRDPAEVSFVIDDYQTEPSLFVSSSGAQVVFGVLNPVEARLDDLDSFFTWNPADLLNGMTRGRDEDVTRGIVFSWASDTVMEFRLVAEERDFTDDLYLAFRTCQVTRHPFTEALVGDAVFSIALRDEDGVTSTIRIDTLGGGLEEPFPRVGGGVGTGWQNEFETVRIRISSFATNSSGIDLTRIVAVVFNVGPMWGDALGSIGLDDLELLR